MAVLKQKSKKRISQPSGVLKHVKKAKTAKKVTTGKQRGATVKKSAVAPKRVSAPQKKSVDVKVVVSVVEATRVTLQKKVIPLAPKPSAQTCPLVLDGILLEEDFSPRECFSCDEFDCRFYAAEERSGPLGSRLFVGGEEEEEGDPWGLLDDAGEDSGEADDGDESDDE